MRAVWGRRGGGVRAVWRRCWGGGNGGDDGGDSEAMCAVGAAWDGGRW